LETYQKRIMYKRPFHNKSAKLPSNIYFPGKHNIMVTELCLLWLYSKNRHVDISVFLIIKRNRYLFRNHRKVCNSHKTIYSPLHQCTRWIAQFRRNFATMKITFSW
jgi:hypothetical protein